MAGILQRLAKLDRRNLYKVQTVSLAIFQKRVITGKGSTLDWNKAVSNAEKVVGYPTSFMSLRCLLSDELSNVALQMRKLVGTRHPLLKTARKFLYDGKHHLQTRGLLVLLISKAAASHRKDTEATVDGIYQSQRNLAEITEMIYTAHAIHKGVVNLERLSPSDGSLADMEFGNKMAVLSGDFLLANASTALAELENPKVVELMSQVIADLARAEFSDLRNMDGDAVLPANLPSLDDWKKQTFLSSGSLLAKSCQAAMLLADRSSEQQGLAYKFGENIAYAHQLKDEIQGFLNVSDENGNSLVMASLPVILMCQQDPSIATKIQLLSEKQVMSLVKSCGILSECKERLLTYGQVAHEAIASLPDSDAKTALANIITAVTDR